MGYMPGGARAQAGAMLSGQLPPEPPTEPCSSQQTIGNLSPRLGILLSWKGLSLGIHAFAGPPPQPDPQFFSLPLDTTSPPRVQRGPHLLPSEGLPRSPCLYSPSLEVVWKLPQAQP